MLHFLQSIGNLTMPFLSLCLSLFCSLCLTLSLLLRRKGCCYKRVKVLDLQDTDLFQFFCNLLVILQCPLSVSVSVSLSLLHKRKRNVINGLNDWTIRKQICCTSRLSVQQNKDLETEKESLDFIVGLRVFSLEFSISYGTG